MLGLGLVLVGLTLTGCGGGGNMASVTGKVTYNGKEVAGGGIFFSPRGQGEGNPGKGAVGKIKNDGTYVLGTYSESDGALIGKHIVNFSPPAIEVKSGTELKPGEKPVFNPYLNLEPKQTEVEVTAGTNTINIELVKKKKN
jgi:hypothetical protein